MSTIEEQSTASIQLEPLRLAQMHVPIVGVTPVIPHKWSEKAKRLMFESQQGVKVKKAREAKVPEQEAEDSTYYLPDAITPGIPSTAFKAAIVGAVRHFEGITLVQAKQLFFVEGEGPDQLVAIQGDRHLREDTPRNSGGNADLRYRFAYSPWECVLRITYSPTTIDQGSVLSLVNAAGMGGVGDWRPSAPKSLTGTFGRFMVDTSRAVETREMTA